MPQRPQRHGDPNTNATETPTQMPWRPQHQRHRDPSPIAGDISPKAGQQHQCSGDPSPTAGPQRPFLGDPAPQPDPNTNTNTMGPQPHSQTPTPLGSPPLGGSQLPTQPDAAGTPARGAAPAPPPRTHQGMHSPLTSSHAWPGRGSLRAARAAGVSHGRRAAGSGAAGGG